MQVYASGRTDAGVHARGQVLHLDLPTTSKLSPLSLQHALNNAFRVSLALPVAVLSASSETNLFHARFSAKSRSYQYRIINRSAHLALELGRAWHVRPALDVTAMQEAARRLEGSHDFATFCR